MSRITKSVLLITGLIASVPVVWAQLSPGLAPPPPASDARAGQVFDPTGYWVSVVTQNWYYRMIVPQRGQYTGVPLNGEARAFADAFNAKAYEAAGKQCEAYGAAAIMQVPARLHITWKDANTLQVDTDAGMQTRLLYFGPTRDEDNQPASLQGRSVAQWMPYRSNIANWGRGIQAKRPAGSAPPAEDEDDYSPSVVTAKSPPPDYGWLKVTTDNMLPGLLRKNGLPYSGQASMTENWALNREPDGAAWLTVTTTLTDPVYLTRTLIENAIFLKEPDGTKWDPTPCWLTALPR